VIDKDGSPYGADTRGLLKGFAEKLHKKSATRSMRRTKSKASCSK